MREQCHWMLLSAVLITLILPAHARPAMGAIPIFAPTKTGPFPFSGSVVRLFHKLCECCRCDAARTDSPETASAGQDTSESTVHWMNRYERAMTAAERQNKMLLIYFCNAGGNEVCNRFKAETLDSPQVRVKLRDYVCVQVPLDASITVKAKQVKLLEHAAFHEMLDRPGIAIVDFRSADAKLRGSVVSVFPITQSLWYTPEQMAVILGLPSGTLTQRTLIYAVRTHPEHPASADSDFNADLAAEAQSHARYQGIHRSPRAPVLGVAFPAHRRPSAGQALGPGGLRRKLAGPAPGRSRRRMRPLVAPFLGPLECRPGVESWLRLRHAARQQRHLVCHGDFCLTVRQRVPKGTVPFSSDENWDSPLTTPCRSCACRRATLPCPSRRPWRPWPAGPCRPPWRCWRRPPGCGWPCAGP